MPLHVYQFLKKLPTYTIIRAPCLLGTLAKCICAYKMSIEYGKKIEGAMCMHVHEISRNSHSLSSLVSSFPGTTIASFTLFKSIPV